MGLLNLNRALALASEVPGAVKETKRYKAHQRESATKVTGSHPPGGAPPMRKVSAHQALNYFLKKQAGGEISRGGIMKAMPAAFAAGMVTAGGDLALRGAGSVVGGVYQRFASKRMCEDITRRYPDIKRNEKKAREAFDLAVAYAPSLLKHPAAIGDFVRRQLEFPMAQWRSRPLAC